MPEINAVGDLVTGAILSAAIEPEHGSGTKTPDAACLNCGTQLQGPHCHHCGQKAKVHRTLGAYAHDLLHGVFHFEGKIWRTLPMLAWKPGELTHRYIHGERAKFVSPLALFLFAVFMMFAVVGGLAGEMHAPDNSKELLIKYRDMPKAELDTQLNAEKAKLAAIDAQLKRAPANQAERDALEKQRDAIDDKIEEIQDVQTLLRGEQPFRVTDAKTGIDRLDVGIARAGANPNLFLYKIQSSAYKYSWALIPLSVPFIWLLFFWKRQFKLYDHAIFVTYSLTFMLFLTVIVVSLNFTLGTYADSITASLALFVPPIHMYRQIRGAYHSSRFASALRTIALSFFAVIVLSLFLCLLIVLGALS